MNNRLIIGGILGFIVFCLIIYFVVFHKKGHNPIPIPPIQKIGEDQDILKLADGNTVRVKQNTWRVEPNAAAEAKPVKTIKNVDFSTDIDKMCLSVCENDVDCIMVTWDGGACNLYGSAEMAVTDITCPLDIKKLSAVAPAGTYSNIDIDSVNTFIKHDLQPTTSIDEWTDSMIKQVQKKTLTDSDPKWCFLLPSGGNIKYQRNTERSIGDESTGAKYNVQGDLTTLHGKCIAPCLNDSECIGWNITYDKNGPATCSLKNSNAECSTSTTTSDFYYKGGNAAYEKKCPPT